MLIGTYTSIPVCKDEGYMLMKYDGRKPFNHKIECTFYQYLPVYVRKEQNMKGYGVPQWNNYNTLDLWELYQANKPALQSFADYHVENIADITDYYDLLILADIVNAYQGIFE